MCSTQAVSYTSYPAGGYSFANHSRGAQAAGYPASGSSVAEHTLRRQQVLERADRHLQRSRQSRHQQPHDEDAAESDAESLEPVREPWLTNRQPVTESLGPGLFRLQQQQEEQPEVQLPSSLVPAAADADDHEQAADADADADADANSLEPLVQEDGIVRQPLGCQLLNSCIQTGDTDLEMQADSCLTWLQHHPLATAATGNVSHDVAAIEESGVPSSELRLQPQGLDGMDVHSLAATAPAASSTSNHGQGLSTLAPCRNPRTPLTPLVCDVNERLALAKLRVEMASLKEQLADKLNEVKASNGVIESLLNEQTDVDRLKEELSTALHTIETLKTSITNDKQGQCVICWEGTPCYALVPCGHLLLCQRCAGRNIEHCPVCRRKVGASLRVYKP